MRTVQRMRPKLSKGTNHCNYHTTPPGYKKGEKGIGKSVKIRDFCNIHGFVGCFFFFLTKTQAFENQWGYSPPALMSQPPSLFAGHPPCWAAFCKEGQTSRGNKWPHSRGRLCPWVGSESPLKPVWFSKQQCQGFQIIFSEHPFKIVTFLSSFPGMGFHISEINYKLWSRDFHSRMHRAGEVHHASLYIIPDTQ